MGRGPPALLLCVTSLNSFMMSLWARSLDLVLNQYTMKLIFKVHKLWFILKVRKKSKID